jgi:gas vesicle protein
MSDQSKGILMFLMGAAVGVAVGYFLASDDKEEIIDNIKNKVNKVKDDLEGQIEKGKKIVTDLKKKATDLLESTDI